MVLLLVMNQAVGGILVAVIMKYADNIMKGFAIAISVCVTVVLNFVIFDSTPTEFFLLAAVSFSFLPVQCPPCSLELMSISTLKLLVSVSLFIYMTCGLPPAAKPTKAQSNTKVCYIVWSTNCHLRIINSHLVVSNRS